MLVTLSFILIVSDWVQFLLQENPPTHRKQTATVRPTDDDSRERVEQKRKRNKLKLKRRRSLLLFVVVIAVVGVGGGGARHGDKREPTATFALLNARATNAPGVDGCRRTLKETKAKRAKKKSTNQIGTEHEGRNQAKRQSNKARDTAATHDRAWNASTDRPLFRLARRTPPRIKAPAPKCTDQQQQPPPSDSHSLTRSPPSNTFTMTAFAQVLVALMLVTCASMLASAAPGGADREIHHSQDGHSHKFGYHINDHHTGDNHGREEHGHGGHHVAGKYFLHDPHGYVRTVDYVADGHAGTHQVVHGSHYGLYVHSPYFTIVPHHGHHH